MVQLELTLYPIPLLYFGENIYCIYKIKYILKKGQVAIMANPTMSQTSTLKLLFWEKIIRWDGMFFSRSLRHISPYPELQLLAMNAQLVSNVLLHNSKSILKKYMVE